MHWKIWYPLPSHLILFAATSINIFLILQEVILLYLKKYIMFSLNLKKIVYVIHIVLLFFPFLRLV